MIEVWANVPDTDHVREWTKIGEVPTWEEADELKTKYINGWSPTSNWLRLQQPGSWKFIDGDNIYYDELGDSDERRTV